MDERKEVLIGMILKKAGRAGGLESGDAMVTAQPNPQGGIQVELESVLKIQFGDSIIETAKRAAQIMDVQDVSLHIVDRGALDHVILSRVQTAIYRAADMDRFDWSKGGGSGDAT